MGVARCAAIAAPCCGSPEQRTVEFVTRAWFRANRPRPRNSSCARSRSARRGIVQDGRSRCVPLVRHACRCGAGGCGQNQRGQGLHVFVPVDDQLTPADSAAVTRAIAASRGALDPHLATTAFMKADRGRKVFVDSAQVAGATVVAVFSPRVRPGVPVSFPVNWDDLDDVAPADFTVHTAIRHLGDGNPWAAQMPRASAPERGPDRGGPCIPLLGCRPCARAGAAPVATSTSRRRIAWLGRSECRPDELALPEKNVTDGLAGVHLRTGARPSGHLLSDNVPTAVTHVEVDTQPNRALLVRWELDVHAGAAVDVETGVDHQTAWTISTRRRSGPATRRCNYVAARADETSCPSPPTEGVQPSSPRTAGCPSKGSPTSATSVGTRRVRVLPSAGGW